MNMKHWNELTELETEIIRVSEFKNLFKLLVAGTENYVDIKVLQSAIYTMEGMIDDIDSTLYEKFQTVFDAVRDDETEGGEEEFRFDTLQEEYQFENGQPFYDNMNFTSENKGSTVTITSNEEEEAFNDLEKAIRNWKPTAP
jgi:hypothetical protein